jgi:uncharacterized protein (TIGR03437 family)
MQTVDSFRRWVGASAPLHLLALGIVVCASMRAQNAAVFDNSGNGTLNGAYFVRQVLTVVDASSSAITRAVAITGTMTFDGKGNYSFTGQKVDSTAGGSAAAYSTQGTYAAAPNGLVQIQNPFDKTDIDYGGIGGVGPSAIVASATQGQYLDILVAIPISASASNGSLQGSFETGFVDFLGANAAQVRDGFYKLTSDGNGNFGSVTISGVMANQGNTLVNQPLSGVTYSLNGGTGTINFPASSTPLTALVSGAKTFDVSTDGNILVGGDPNGFDMIVGVKAVSSASNSMFQGTYYSGALENDTSSGNAVDSLYGSTLALGDGNHINHYRWRFFGMSAYDYTSDGFTNLASDGTDNNGEFETILGANGQAVLQVGVSSYYSLTVYFQTQKYTGNGPFINPVDIWNAASFAPITNPVAPGEYVSIFGTGLASSTVPAQSFPLLTTLGNVQVMVNGVAAPLDYVSPTQINFVIPYETTGGFATFQVISDKTPSNQVTVYTSGSAPGVFAITSNGIGPAAVTHADGSLVTQSSPAVAGETLVLYVTGLGAVNPSVADGVAAPSSPLSYVNESINVDIQDTNGKIYSAATPAFAGLTPGFAGLYQINFVVPSGVPSGEQWVNVGTQDAYTSEARIYMQ